MPHILNRPIIFSTDSAWVIVAIPGIPRGSKRPFRQIISESPARFTPVDPGADPSPPSDQPETPVYWSLNELFSTYNRGSLLISNRWHMAVESSDLSGKRDRAMAGATENFITECIYRINYFDNFSGTNSNPAGLIF